jgi:hypothetical protein
MALRPGTSLPQYLEASKVLQKAAGHLVYCARRRIHAKISVHPKASGFDA